MKPSSFQTTIENQFDYICKRAMEDERKNYMLYLSRIAKREVSFSDVGDYLVSQFATTDNYSTDFQIFTLNGLSVGVENENTISYDSLSSHCKGNRWRYRSD